MAEKIKDFGEKIGGARKDIWRAEGMTMDDIMGLTDEEKDYYINRDMVWPIPRSRELVESGLDVIVAFWQREIRKKVRKYPLILNTDDKGQIQEGYIRMVGKIRDRVMQVSSTNEFSEFFDEVRNGFGDPDLFRRCACRNDMYDLKYNLSNMRYRCQRQNFPYGNGSAGKKARKKSFPMPLLEHIRRGGPDVRRGRKINADIWQREFSFRGVEFGNWLSQKDRQDSMNYCYEALHDLADALEIDKKDIAFGGELALAFGARGRSGAASHYEFMRRVINLTKMHGAGTLAHEWAYALDHMLAGFYGINDAKFASCSKQTEKLPEVLNKLYRAMVKDEDGNRIREISQKYDGVFGTAYDGMAILNMSVPLTSVADDAAKKLVIEKSNEFAGIIINEMADLSRKYNYKAEDGESYLTEAVEVRQGGMENEQVKSVEEQPPLISAVVDALINKEATYNTAEKETDVAEGNVEDTDTPYITAVQDPVSSENSSEETDDFDFPPNMQDDIEYDYTDIFKEAEEMLWEPDLRLHQPAGKREPVIWRARESDHAYKIG